MDKKINSNDCFLPVSGQKKKNKKMCFSSSNTFQYFGIVWQVGDKVSLSKRNSRFCDLMINSNILRCCGKYVTKPLGTQSNSRDCSLFISNILECSGKQLFKFPEKQITSNDLVYTIYSNVLKFCDEKLPFFKPTNRQQGMFYSNIFQYIRIKW